MIEAGFANLKTVLCLGAHADDIEIGCGGTILRLLAQNPALTVHWIVFSAAGVRREEALEGARLFLGETAMSRVVVESFEDSFFPQQSERIKRLFHQIGAEISPDIVFTHRRNDAHQDHRTIAELTWCTFRNHLVLEYEIPKYEGDLGNPNFFVRLNEETCAKKVRNLMKAYRSQQDKHWFTEDLYWSLLRLRGIECCSPGRYAEGFYVRKVCY
jgi:LmbE family N-acetylglucosaminyl deacetylase